MKRTEKKLKAKGLKSHASFGGHCLQEYDRKYVSNHYGDFNHLPFSRGRLLFEKSDGWYNERLRKYLERFLRKHVGKKLDVVFHEFKELGWKSSKEMYYYWDRYVERELELESEYGFYQLSEHGTLLLNEFDNSIVKEDSEEKVKRQTASRKKLTRKQLEYNANVNARPVGNDPNHKPTYIYPDLIGNFYIEYEHKVILCPVYHIVHLKCYNWRMLYNDMARRFVPVKIMGKYREEMTFEQHRWVSVKVLRGEAPTDETSEEMCFDIGCRILIPRVDIKEAQQLLKEATI